MKCVHVQMSLKTHFNKYIQLNGKIISFKNLVNSNANNKIVVSTAVKTHTRQILLVYFPSFSILTDSLAT